jgi:flagellar M-ring protein FliF
MAAIPAQVQNLKTLLAKFTLQQKIALGAAGALVLVMVWLATFLANRIDYQMVFSDLEATEAQSIVQKLQELKVDYKLSTDGRSISVASEKASEVRIQLASQGLPSSGRIGFEIFDQTNFGLTNFQEQVNYQRALEGELARSIMTLNEVEAARVHLVLPKESLFQSAEDQTKASVILKLKSGRNLGETAVQGIVNVVASSVKGLTPERITLIDYRGKVLARPEAEGALTGPQSDERQQLENEMTMKIVQILEPAVGQGKVRPQVSVSMSFQQVEETTERYDPQSSVIRSQQKSEERSPFNQVNNNVAMGIPGPKGQQGAKPPAAGAAPPPAAPVTPETYVAKQNETTSYEVSKAVRHTVEPVGKLNRVSVAVIIDNHSKTTTGPDGKTQVTSEPRSAEEMKKYRDIVSATVGFNPERGDKLTVENMSFADDSAFVHEPTLLEKQGPLILTALRYLIIPIAFILIYLLFLRPVKKIVFATLSPAPAAAPVAGGPQMVKALPPANFPRVQTPMTVKQLEAQLAGVELPRDEYANTPEREILPLPGPSKMEVIRDRVIEHASHDPETVARLVRVWLNDEKSK